MFRNLSKSQLGIRIQTGKKKKTHKTMTPSIQDGKGKVVPVLQLSTTPWRRIGGVEAHINSFFDLGTRWR
jgi:hypothetical protein